MERQSEVVPHADYVAEYYPPDFPTAAASHITVQSHPLPLSYPQPLPAHPQGKLQTCHQPYYPVSIHENLNQIYAEPVQIPLLGSSFAHFPTATASHVSIQSHPLPSSYPQPLPAYPQREAGELQPSHQPYYPVSVHENQNEVYAEPVQKPLVGSSSGTNVPISFCFSYAGGAPTHC